MPPKQTSGIDSDSILKEIASQSLVVPSLITHRAVKHVRQIGAEFQPRSKRVDYCAVLDHGTILHIEFQSHPDPEMPRRMALYALLMHFNFKDTEHKNKKIKQCVIFTAKGRVGGRGKAGGGTFRCDVFGLAVEYDAIDARTIDHRPFLASKDWKDNVFALFCDGNTDEKISKIKTIYSDIPDSRRYDADRVLLLAGMALRIYGRIKTEIPMTYAKKILTTDPDFSGLVDELRQEGRQEGRLEGRQEGRLEGEARILAALLRAKGWSAEALLAAVGEADIVQMASVLGSEPDITEAAFAARFHLLRSASAD